METGTCRVAMTERATLDQRGGLTRIRRGKKTKEMGTLWWVFNAMSPQKGEPLFAPIDFEVAV